jgi:glycosyltransferase involved in cell wall biosynthesis
MAGTKVSIIIPACNEEKYIQKTLESLKAQSHRPIEIIVVVNGSKDKTFEIAKDYTDKVLNFSRPIGPVIARNEGAKKAEGDIFIFLDADTQLSRNTAEKAVRLMSQNTFGTCLGKPDAPGLKGRLFFTIKNYIHRLIIYKGVVDGVLFCHRDIFFKINGFNEKKLIAEFADFTKRAIKAGGKYIFIKGCYSIICLRRYEEKGYLQGLFFWVRWKVSSLLKKGDKLEKEYFKKI